MAADSIEREILIDASPEVVWRVITEPEQISRWFTDDAQFQARAGVDGTLTWRPGGRAGQKDFDTVVPIQVVEAEPLRRFSFRWDHPDGERPDRTNSALVEFSLSEEAGRTRLRVVESGIDAVANDDEKARHMEDHERGWEKHLGELRDYVASESSEATR